MDDIALFALASLPAKWHAAKCEGRCSTKQGSPLHTDRWRWDIYSDMSSLQALPPAPLFEPMKAQVPTRRLHRGELWASEREPTQRAQLNKGAVGGRRSRL